MYLLIQFLISLNLFFYSDNLFANNSSKEKIPAEEDSVKENDSTLKNLNLSTLVTKVLDDLKKSSSKEQKLIVFNKFKINIEESSDKLFDLINIQTKESSTKSFDKKKNSNEPKVESFSKKTKDLKNYSEIYTSLSHMVTALAFVNITEITPSACQESKTDLEFSKVVPDSVFNPNPAVEYDYVKSILKELCD